MSGTVGLTDTSSLGADGYLWAGKAAHCTSSASSNNTRLRLALLKHFLALGEDPVLDIQDFVLGGFLRQVLHHLAHVRAGPGPLHPGSTDSAGSGSTSHRTSRTAATTECIPAFGQLRRRLLLLEQFLHPVDHLRALLTHALGLQVDGGQRRTGGQRQQFDTLFLRNSPARPWPAIPGSWPRSAAGRPAARSGS